MENNSVTSGKFVCPNDFAEVVNTEGLCLEDIDDDSELFIIQASVDSDLRKLHGQQLVLSEPTRFSFPSVNGHKEEVYKCTTIADDKQLAKGCLILPERNSMKLCGVEKHIEGIIYIQKGVAFSQMDYLTKLDGRSKESAALQKRAAPLSSGNHTVLSGDYSKKGVTDNLPRADDLSSRRVKKKKQNGNIIQDESLPKDIPVKNKKKHKENREKLKSDDDERGHRSSAYLSVDEIKKESDDDHALGNSSCMDSLSEGLSDQKKKSKKKKKKDDQ